MIPKGFSGGASGKELPCQCRRHKRCGFDPLVKKIPQRRKWQTSPIFLPEESHGQRSLAGYSSRDLQRVKHDWSDLAWKDSRLAVHLWRLGSGILHLPVKSVAWTTWSPLDCLGHPVQNSSWTETLLIRFHNVSTYLTSQIESVSFPPRSKCYPLQKYHWKRRKSLDEVILVLFEIRLKSWDN